MGQIVSFHPTEYDLLNFYEVVESEGASAGETIWGGESESEAIAWFRRTRGARLMVQAWATQELDAHPIGQPIDITKMIKATIGAVK